MKPYYSEKGIEIYHGDCREILPSLPVVDLVLTDPPYNASNSKATFAEKGYAAVNEDWDKGFQVASFVDLAFAALSPTGSLVSFCSYHLLGEYLAWKTPQQIIHWRKTNPFPAIAKVYTPSIEYAVWFVKGSPYTFNKGKAGQNIIDLPFCNGNERWRHPTQKPLELIARLASVHSNESDLILDPFMGSGTTLRAAKDLGRKAIGIEIEEAYCEIAANRLRQEVLQFAL